MERRTSLSFCLSLVKEAFAYGRRTSRTSRTTLAFKLFHLTTPDSLSQRAVADTCAARFRLRPPDPRRWNWPHRGWRTEHHQALLRTLAKARTSSHRSSNSSKPLLRLHRVPKPRRADDVRHQL